MTTNSQNNVISIKPLLLEKGFSEELINKVIANNKFKRLYNYTNVKKGELSKKYNIYTIKYNGELSDGIC